MKEAEGKFRSGSDGKTGFGNAETALSPGSQKNIDPSSKFPVNSKRNILLFHTLNGFTVSRSANNNPMIRFFHWLQRLLLAHLSSGTYSVRKD